MTHTSVTNMNIYLCCAIDFQGDRRRNTRSPSWWFHLHGPRQDIRSNNGFSPKNCLTHWLFTPHERSVLLNSGHGSRNSYLQFYVPSLSFLAAKHSLITLRSCYKQIGSPDWPLHSRTGASLRQIFFMARNSTRWTGRTNSTVSLSRRPSENAITTKPSTRFSGAVGCPIEQGELHPLRTPAVSRFAVGSNPSVENGIHAPNEPEQSSSQDL